MGREIEVAFRAGIFYVKETLPIERYGCILYKKEIEGVWIFFCSPVEGVSPLFFIIFTINSKKYCLM